MVVKSKKMCCIEIMGSLFLPFHFSDTDASNVAVIAGTPAAFLEYDDEGYILAITERVYVSGGHGAIILVWSWTLSYFFFLVCMTNKLLLAISSPVGIFLNLILTTICEHVLTC